MGSSYPPPCCCCCYHIKSQNQVHGHTTGSSHSEAEEYLWKGEKQVLVRNLGVDLFFLCALGQSMNINFTYKVLHSCRHNIMVKRQFFGKYTKTLSTVVPPIPSKVIIEYQNTRYKVW